jgi:YidC/Oxa1 family membrane protein insertase
LIRKSGYFLFILFLLLFITGCSTEALSQPIDLKTAGWFTKFFTYPLVVTLDWFANKLWGLYALSIMIVTIIIRFLILPLTIKQYRSSKKMQDLQPELKKLKEKFKDDTRKQQEETMKLFQQNNVNPLSGCFPLIVQMPILIALYQAIMRNEHIREQNFLWMNLGTPDQYFILPLIAALTTYLQQQFMPTQPNPQMKALFIIFPILIFVMSLNFASALPLYWIFSNIFTIIQSYFMYGRSLENKGGLAK